MTTHVVTAKLGRLLAFNYDFIEVCDDIKLLGDKVELDGAIKMSKEEVLNKYSADLKISRWVYTIEKDKKGIAIVIGDDSNEE